MRWATTSNPIPWPWPCRAFSKAFSPASPTHGESTPAGEEDKTAKEELPPEPIITESPDSARLVVIGSSEFINDTVIGISRSLGQDRFLNSLEFLHNAVDWAVEDQELLAIRSRGSHARLLAPMDRKEQRFWEWLNYGIALTALVLVAVAGWFVGRREKPLSIA